MGSIITKQTNLRKPTTTKGSKSSSAWSSPRTQSKQLLKLLSDKAFLAVAGKKKTTDEDPYEQVEEVEGLKEEEEEEEREGVWKKSILMGEKCQPLDFSGVIYYDNHGHRLSHVPPRSPRASPFPGRREAY
ncbi:hypothetical protein QJS04_geneDACA017586 [Acorus gramineus]|uniref:Uncharacterized protein n=1 Tax=Acorus gramineus TaxID=55184 RepID=A0AAV9AWY2_ACOGR|nr:hypothetical protein QJS04_geneDACA017586 [Acorus gramineus]